jgi:hypothetical protein
MAASVGKSDVFGCWLIAGIIREVCDDVQKLSGLTTKNDTGLQPHNHAKNARQDANGKKEKRTPHSVAVCANGAGSRLTYLKASRLVTGALLREITVLRECLLACIPLAAAVSSSSVVSPSSGKQATPMLRPT